MTRPSVAIVVLNYNGRDALAEYLPSVMALDYENYRVVVVDNDSSDDSVAFLREEYPSVEVVENDENVGISTGYNRGGAAAPDADYLWFMNNDVEVTPDSLSRLVDHAESKPSVGVVVPRVNHMGTDTIQTMGFHYDRFGRMPPIDRGSRTPARTEPHEIPFGIGAAMLVDRDVWEAIGGFDDANFVYGDDNYIGLQAWVRGYHVEVVPDSLVYHERGDQILDPEMEAYHAAMTDSRVLLKTLQTRSLIVGIPGFCAQLGGRMLKDVLLRDSPGVAKRRLAGLAATLRDLPTIYRERKRIQRERKYDDDRFLSPLFGKRASGYGDDGPDTD